MVEHCLPQCNNRSNGACKFFTDVSLASESAGKKGMLGSNGAGKTTTVEIVERLRVPSFLLANRYRFPVKETAMHR